MTVGGQILNATVNGTTWSVTVPQSLADGTYNVQATATDNAGNVGIDSTTNELTVETVPPRVTVNYLVTNHPRPTLSGTVSDPAPARESRASRWLSAIEFLTAVVSGTVWTVSVPISLSDGTYNVQATATDNAGNISTDVTISELTVDTKAPFVTINTLVTNLVKPILTGTILDPGPSSGITGVTIVIGGQSLAATINGTTWSVAVPLAWLMESTMSRPRPRTMREMFPPTLRRTN